jgi:hypothetical protein
MPNGPLEDWRKPGQTGIAGQSCWKSMCKYFTMNYLQLRIRQNRSGSVKPGQTSCHDEHKSGLVGFVWLACAGQNGCRSGVSVADWPEKTSRNPLTLAQLFILCTVSIVKD